MARSRIAVLLAVIVVGFSFSGCDDKGAGRVLTHPAGGVVKFTDGQPIANATISFVSPQGELATAISDAEGKFQLGTLKDNDGAIVGKHRVSVEPPIVRGGDPKSVAASAVPARYKVADTSGLEFEVKPDGENQFEIIVERK
jgi:hypothetical protein